MPISNIIYKMLQPNDNQITANTKNMKSKFEKNNPVDIT